MQPFSRRWNHGDRKTSPSLRPWHPQTAIPAMSTPCAAIFWPPSSKALTDNKLLTGHQIRGAFAHWLDDLKADLKSIAASGWWLELIPDADILESRFPEILAEMKKKRLRLAELAALFSAAGEERLRGLRQYRRVARRPEKPACQVRDRGKADRGQAGCGSGEITGFF